MMAVLLCCPFLQVPASAQQSDTGQIRIIVTDDSGKNPLELARVLLDGPVITSELTSKKGEVLFTDVPDGIYHARIAKSGYQVVTSPSFEIINGRAVTVNVSLALTTQLKVIGTVTAHSTATVSTSAINQDSAQRKLSDDLAGALNKLSGVNVSTTSDDSDAEQTISLEGHDPSQTQLTLDGIPLNAPGVAGNLNGFATDLFQGASMHMGPQVGGLGGGVNFSTLQPTLSWMSDVQLATGNNGKYNYSFAETGSFDKLGIALQTVYRLQPSLVDGEHYLDASGLDYSHDGDTDVSGNLFKARYQFGDSQNITATFLNSTRDTNIVCLRITSDIPCGYGPNNYNSGSTQLYSVTDDALVGETSVQASVYSTATSGLVDELNRYVNGEAQPNGFSNDTDAHGYTLNVTLPAKTRHTISIQSYGTWSQVNTTPLVSQSSPYYTNFQTSNYSSLQATDSIHSNEKLTLSDSVGISRALNNQSSLLGTVAANWHPTSVDTYTASYSLGGVAASISRSSILTDPASLRFDCNGGAAYAYGNAPGDEPGASSSTSARLGYTRALHGGSISLTLYRQVQQNVVLPVQVNGTALLANGTLSPAYIAAVQSLYASPAGCGAQNNPLDFTAKNLYFSTPIGGVERLYQGGAISGYITLGWLVIQPYYDVNVSQAISNNPLIQNPYSITISGQQVPNVPLQKAGITLDYKAPRSAVEYLADAQYSAKNNPNNLPAYTTFDAGVSTQLNAGTLTFAASNITNVYQGIFASPLYSVPYVTLAGTEVPTIARPLTPRSYSVTYNVKFGAGAAGLSQTPEIGRRSAAGRDGGYGGGPEGGPGGPGGPGGTATYVAGPGGGGPPPEGGQGPGPNGGSGGRGTFRLALTPIPSSPPSNPLDVTTGSQLCTGEAVTTAQKFSSELKSYVAQIEAAKTSAGYPASMASPVLDDMTVVYHGLGQTYALTITPKLQPAPSPSPTTSANGSTTTRRVEVGRGMRAFVGCLPLHVAREGDVKAHNLFAPNTGLFFVPQVQFMPAVGLYFVARQQQAGQESFRVYALPTKPPADPFEVRTADSCTAELKNTATQALGQLRAYFANGAKPALWTITPHQSASGTWYELNPGDPTIIGSLLMCGRLAAATADDLKTRGYDGATPPEVNYTQALGLYILRPNRPPGQGPGPGGPGGPPPAPSASPAPQH